MTVPQPDTAVAQAACQESSAASLSEEKDTNGPGVTSKNKMPSDSVNTGERCFLCTIVTW